MWAPLVNAKPPIRSPRLWRLSRGRRRAHLADHDDVEAIALQALPCQAGAVARAAVGGSHLGQVVACARQGGKGDVRVPVCSRRLKETTT